MSTHTSSAVRSTPIMRIVARVVLGVAALEVGISLYSVLSGGVQFRIAGHLFSSLTWFRPLTHASVAALVAAACFSVDAVMHGQWDLVPRTIWHHVSGADEVARRRLLWAAVLIGSFVSLLVTYRVCRQWMTIGSGDAGWIYPYLHSLTLKPFVTFAAVSAVVVAALRWSGHVRREWVLVGGWTLLGFVLQALLHQLSSASLESIFASGVANSFYDVTQRYDAASVLADFARLRGDWPIHAHANMPGKLMFVYALEVISSSPAVLGWLIAAISSLGGVVVYRFVRDLFDDRRVALYSLILYMFVPGRLFFVPLLNTITPVLAFTLAWLVLGWLRTGRVVYAAACGVAIFGVAFFEPLPLVAAWLFAALAVRAVWRGEFTWRQLLVQSAVVALGIVATYAILRATTGFDFVDGFRRVIADAGTFNERAGRPYRIWVRQNLFDVLFTAGVAQSLLIVVALVDGLSADRWRGRALARPIVLFSLSLIAMMLSLDLAGLNRGEVHRLWIYLACFLQIPAAYVCARLRQSSALALVLATTLLQTAVSLATVGFVIP